MELLQVVLERRQKCLLLHISKNLPLVGDFIHTNGSFYQLSVGAPGNRIQLFLNHYRAGTSVSGRTRLEGDWWNSNRTLLSMHTPRIIQPNHYNRLAYAQNPGQMVIQDFCRRVRERIFNCYQVSTLIISEEIKSQVIDALQISKVEYQIYYA